MIIWELSTTDGENTSYRVYALKGEGHKAKREFKKQQIDCDGPKKIKISNRDELIAYIAKLQGNSGTSSETGEDDPASEFI